MEELYKFRIIKDHISVEFANNIAQYGGAIFLDATAAIVNDDDKIHIDFKDNAATVFGNLVYQEASELCNSGCLNSKIRGISTKYITTQPNKLKFNDPAICIEKVEGLQCNN